MTTIRKLYKAADSVVGYQKRANFLHTLRYRLGNYFVWSTREDRDKLMINHRKDICIEGYPRSANTYTVLLVEKYADRPLEIGHHLHLAAQLKRAIHYDIPAVLLIRKPQDAITSLLLRERAVSIENAIKWYIYFHKGLRIYKDRLIIWEFNELINDPASHLKMLQQRVKNFSIEVGEIDSEAIFQEIDQLDRITKEKEVSANEFNLINSRPGKGKKQKKEQLLAELKANPKYRAWLEECEELYQFFTTP
ncbi:hypothetical protein SAMN05421823_102488 [Catalinimonas alkaloidigena]|uniref:Sulfotransferase domain-containing protein n=1 Tax=Catalinimonas alkaloidigena TaxID=1075417 RepID=A0A1G9B297_9BACT|nr:hypothetical protein [Catalinimonas alkaloidigena]SDK33647.1 hypothetical protein SAMN05421823_102488 [Catalinimonas alkaloidigena]